MLFFFFLSQKYFKIERMYFFIILNIFLLIFSFTIFSYLPYLSLFLFFVPGKFLSLKDDNVGAIELADRFYFWLQSIGTAAGM